MSVGVSIIDSPMQISSNFILSVEANDLNGYNVGDPINSMVDNAIGNNLVRANILYGGYYKIDSFGFKCVNFLGVAGQGAYNSSINYVQPTEVTYVIVFNAGVTSRQIIQRFDPVAGFRENTLLTGSAIRTDINPNSTPNQIITSNAFTIGSKSIFAYRRKSSGLCESFVGMKNANSIQLNNLTFSTSSVKFQMFQDMAGGTSVFLGDIYQIHICQEALSDEKLKKLIRYSAFKSGIQI